MLRQPSSTKNANGKALLCATLVAALGAGACNDESSDAADGAEELQEVQSSPTSDTPFFASVKANGTGCPARTWTAKLAEDGQSFRILFTGFENEVNRRRSVDVKDCQLTISVTSPADQQYAVESYGYTGYAYLQEGANAKITSTHYFQGNAANKVESTTELRAPYDKSYDLTVKTSDALWSECGKQRDLNVRTTVRLQGTGGRTSTISLQEIAGIKLSVRKCDGGDAGPTPTPDAGPEPTPDAGPEPTPDAGPGPEPDAGPGPEPSTGPNILSVTPNGTGCAGDVATIADDKKSFHISFKNWEVNTTGSTSSFKDCILMIGTEFTKGTQVALKSWGFKTDRNVAEGANIRLAHVVAIQGSSKPATNIDENGPLSGPYEYKIEVPDAELTWTPCDAARDINPRATFRLAKQAATTDSSVKILETGNFKFITRSCN